MTRHLGLGWNVVWNPVSQAGKQAGSHRAQEAACPLRHPGRDRRWGEGRALSEGRQRSVLKGLLDTKLAGSRARGCGAVFSPPDGTARSGQQRALERSCERRPGQRTAGAGDAAAAADYAASGRVQGGGLLSCATPESHTPALGRCSGSLGHSRGPCTRGPRAPEDPFLACTFLVRVRGTEHRSTAWRWRSTHTCLSSVLVTTVR